MIILISMFTERLGKTVVTVPDSVGELTTACFERSSFSDTVRFAPGIYFEGVPEEEKAPALGEFALEFVYPQTGDVLARCGFDLGLGILEIGHTPQGCYPDQLDSAARRFLGRKGFRTSMVEHLKLLAMGVSLNLVKGTAAQNSQKVRSGIITLERGLVIMDRVFMATGFQKGRDGDFYFNPGDNLADLPVN